MQNMNKVLVIDDEYDVREMLEDYLTAASMNVKTAENGKIGLNVFEEFQPDIAVVDIQMNVMNGIEFSKKVIAENPDFPIIIITGYYSEYDIDEILALGVKEVVKKPLQLDKLFSSLQKYIA